MHVPISVGFSHGQLAADTFLKEINMPGTIQSAGLNPAGGIPEVEVIFGQAQIGTYRSFLWDTSASNPQQLAHGNNVDGLPDKFTVGVAANALPGRYVSVEAVIQTATSAPGQLYSLTVLIRQDGNVVAGGLIQDTGQFTSNTIALFEFARFA
jgi:hypothetical protein